MSHGFAGEIPAELYPIIICEKMGWTYQQYLEQPKWFIDGLSAVWSSQAKIANKKTNG